MHLPWCIKGNRHRVRCLNTGNQIPGDWSWGSVFSCPVNTACIYTSHGHCSSRVPASIAWHSLALARVLSPAPGRAESVPVCLFWWWHYCISPEWASSWVCTVWGTFTRPYLPLEVLLIVVQHPLGPLWTPYTLQLALRLNLRFAWMAWLAAPRLDFLMLAYKRQEVGLPQWSSGKNSAF